MLEDRSHAAALSISELGAGLSIPPARVIAGLRRLHHHRLLVFDPDEGLLGVSGFAPSVGPQVFAGLSMSSQLAHRRLIALSSASASPPPAPPEGAPPGASPRAAARRARAV